MTSYFHSKFIYISNNKRNVEIHLLVFDWRSFEDEKICFEIFTIKYA